MSRAKSDRPMSVLCGVSHAQPPSKRVVAASSERSDERRQEGCTFVDDTGRVQAAQATLTVDEW